MILNKLLPIITLLTLSACTTAPQNPIAANPVVITKSVGNYEISVSGLPGKRPIDVERGFHEVADKACLGEAGWSGWKMLGDSQITPVWAPSGVYKATGTIVCSK